ncbi:septum formation protein [Breznakibacter xylanolyticus]|uniref:dTTP/UTP pyrophosphatase n=1 Tax=Breznakibacter xylanolyticus TaxID=990 RepID=A0A2W7NML4_9BACT|nr:Maf family protein [Breznakibacter xylanolyticus]MBN2743468.1 septum formation protein Maf [Marinilabiliaceae bacterium]PZX17904.1 septum formation protein [Breznakibacter xylanolyticus]
MNHLLPNLAGYDILLASQSPRRQELLGGLGIPFTVYVKEGIKETLPPHIGAHQAAEYLAHHKSESYATELSNGHTIVITADTIVVVDDQILGKPADAAEALRMLRLLSGRQHEVLTGVAIKSANKTVSFTASTKVWFKTLSDAEIDFYIAQYAPYDKAGAYGIQEWIGYVGIEKIDGSYFNVMGLPVQRLYAELGKF